MDKSTLIVLHGANGSWEEMAPLIKPLVAHFDLRAINLLGHGGRLVPDSLTIEALADDLLGWLKAEGIERAFFLGYSLGGYLALHLARHHPERALGVAAIAPKVVFDEALVAHTSYLADPARLSRPGNPRKSELERLHGADKWEAVTLNVRRLFQSFGERPPLSDDELRQLATPVLVLNGDRDQIVSVAETRRIVELLPNARLGLFPGPAHPLRSVPVLPAVRAIRRFIEEVAAGPFTPGPELDLAETLVSGGLAGPDLRASITRDRQKP